MCDILRADDPAAALLERRWFAAARAASQIQAECDALAEVLDMTQEAWRSAMARLAHLENLRDSLGDELSVIDHREPRRASADAQRSVA
jgi:hypothetical protein